MARESLLSDLRESVAAGEALRQDLERDLVLAEGAERAPVEVEMAMLYGRAFALVAAALSVALEPRSRAMEALHAAIQGRAVFGGWLDAETPAAGAKDLDRMGSFWGRIVGLVTSEQT